MSGEEVTYQYDQLGRLIAAATTGPEWGQSYVYDGFGNLTQQVVTKGTAPSMSMIVNQSNNRITGTGITYDLSGNMSPEVSGQLRGMSYDVLNRISTVTNWAYATENYFYSARNERIVVRRSNSPDEVNFYGADGLLLGVYKIEQHPNNQSGWVYPVRIDDKERVYFGGRLIAMGSGPGGTQAIVTDRLGSVVKKGSQGYRYYPYGQEIGGATANDTAKYATYTRDSFSGLDYAMNRFYNNEWGRFTSPDQGPPDPANPQSWNRYSYVWSDPVNLNDPDGLLPGMAPSCSPSPFMAPGGSIDTSSNCPPGYVNVGDDDEGGLISISPLKQLANTVMMLEDIGVLVTPAGRGYNLSLDADLFNELIDSGTLRVGAGGVTTLGGVVITVDVIGIMGGSIGTVLTSSVTITVVGVATVVIVGWQIYQTTRGNVKDTGIQAEAEELVRRGAAQDICDALGKMLKEAKVANNSGRQKRIVKTQKGNDCR